jgi:hypothetical protein
MASFETAPRDTENNGRTNGRRKEEAINEERAGGGGRGPNGTGRMSKFGFWMEEEEEGICKWRRGGNG